MQDQYRIARVRGKLTLIYYDREGTRRRHVVGTDDASEAEHLAPALYYELTKPKSAAVADLWQGYMDDMSGRAVVETMKHTWKALKKRFGTMAMEDITIADCRAHIAYRRTAGIKDGTINTELGHLRMVALWAQKHKHITTAPSIERPPKPKPSDHHLTKKQCGALINATEHQHIKLFVILALTTGARTGAILDLTWDRVDLERGLVNMEDPTIRRPHKGRAIVPVNNALRAALEKARRPDGYVVQWGGRRVSRVRKALTSAGNRAKVGKVWPHLLRHSAAVHMAEAGTGMEEIAQFLGHEDVEVTRRIYARYSPEYLRKAASALEYDVG